MAKTRMETFKDYLFYGILIFFLVGPLTAGALGPGLVNDYIKRENPAGRPVQPWATQWMYYLAISYGFQLNDTKAAAVYLELIDWYNDEDRAIAEDDLWVGRSIFKYADLLWGKRKRAHALEYFQFFLDQWSEHPDIEKDLVIQAQTRVRIYQSGG